MLHIRNSKPNSIFLLEHEGIPTSLLTDFNEPIINGSLCIDITNQDIYILKNDVWNIVSGGGNINVGNGISINNDIIELGGALYQSTSIGVANIYPLLIKKGATTTVNFATSTFYNDSGYVSANWNTHILNALDTNLSLDWGNRQLKIGNIVTLDWNDYKVYDSNGIASINWSNRSLIDNNGVESIDYRNRLLRDNSGNAVINYGGSTLNTFYNTVGIDFGGSFLLGLDTKPSINYGNRLMYDSSNYGSIDYDNRYLSNSSGIAVVQWNNDDVRFTSNSSIIVPVGDTIQRSVTPQLGMLRYNTDTNKFEGYSTSGWVNLS